MIGHTCSLLLDAGALDVYSTSIQMKKNRPGVMISVLCRAEQVSALEQILFRETTTLGIRRHSLTRNKLPREIHTVDTTWGPVDGKIVHRADGNTAFSPEFESCKKISVQQSLPIRQVMDEARRVYHDNG